MMSIVERLTGEGPVTREDGTLIGTRGYDLTIYQKMLDAGGGETIPGLRRIEGRLALEGMEAYTLVAANQKLLLKLDDGRVFPFFVSNSNGAVAAAGNLE